MSYVEAYSVSIQNKRKLTNILHPLYDEVAPSSASDVDCYVIVRKLLDSVLNIILVFIRRC
jgi:hypothetical protein